MDEVEQNIVICQWRADWLRQIIDLRDTNKLRHFAITEFNNCFIIQSPSLFFDKYPPEAAIFTQDRSQEGERRGFFYASVEFLQPNAVGRHCA